MKQLNVKYKTIVKSRKQALWLSILNAVLLLLMCYFADNIGYSIMSGPSVGQRIEQFRELTGIAKDRIPDEYVFINIAYDRQLVPVYDEYDLPQGEIDITDRNKLSTFLKQLDNKHKYILLDVLLSDKYQSDSDSILSRILLTTDRISVSRSATTNLIDEKLTEKAGYTDYSTDIYETNFVKYEFIKDGDMTMPYMAYRALDPQNTIHSLGPIYWSNCHLYWKSLTLRFPIKLWNNPTVDTDNNTTNLQEKKILNLGADILDIGIDIPSLVKDKIVVIGDFTEDDIHDTYLGKIAGPIININALEALRNSELEIPWWLIIFLFLFYSSLSYVVIRNIALLPRFLNKMIEKRKFLRYLFSFIGFSMVFSLIGGIIYLIGGMDINVIIPSVWFTFIKGITNKISS